MILKRLLLWLTVSLLACTLIGFFGRMHWLFDLFSHFRIQYLVIALLFGLIAARQRQKLVIWLSIGILMINLIQVAPYYQPTVSAQPSATNTELRVMSMNVNSDLGNEQASIASILAADADMVAIIELNPTLAGQLATLEATYPYQLLQTMPNSHFGIGLLSKYPLVRQDVLWLAPDDTPSLYAEVTIADGATVAVLATHPSPPILAHGSKLRTMRFDALAEFVSVTSLPIIVLGDLNATPWSADMRQLIGSTRLHDSALGHGLRPTWLSRQHPFGIPIDYVLVSAEFSTRDHDVAPFIRSDHFPIVVTLQLNQ